LEARDFLLECLLVDPRWDSQVESRGHLYVELAELTGLESAPLIGFLTSFEPATAGWSSEADLALQVLASIAARGDANARDAFRPLVAVGPLWSDALAQVEAHEELWEGYDALLAERLQSDEFAADLKSELYRNRVESEPWLSWQKRQPALARVVQSVLEKERGARAQPNTSDIETSELLRRSGSLPRTLAARRSEQDVRLLREAATGDDDRAKGNALQALGKQGDPSFIDAAADVLRRDQPGFLRGAAHRYLAALPAPAALARAREWFVGEAALRTAGAMILERHAEPSDIPLLLDELIPALRAGDMYRLCSILEALVRFTGHGPFPGVQETFVEAPYSYARIRATRILSQTDPSFADGLAYECLWDCEEETREIAVSRANPNLPGAAERTALLQSEADA